MTSNYHQPAASLIANDSSIAATQKLAQLVLDLSVLRPGRNGVSMTETFSSTFFLRQFSGETRRRSFRQPASQPASRPAS